MPINKDVKTPNGINVSYHKPVKLEVDLVNNVAVTTVNSYADEGSANAGLPVAWQWRLGLDVSLLAGDQPTLLAEVEHALISTAGSEFYDGEVSTDNSLSLDSLKERKRATITRDRLAADADHFTYQYTVTGKDAEPVTVIKDIKTADKDMVDLLTTNSYVTLFGEFDEDWPGGWKAIDNSYVPIATVDEWKLFFKAMYKKGIANFKRSQVLKVQIDAATTAEEIQAINWNYVPLAAPATLTS